MWKISGCKMRGEYHAQKDLPCQDSIYGIQEQGISVIALGDGAGSAAYSELGSDLVTRQAGKLLMEHFDRYYAMEDAEQVKEEFLGSLVRSLQTLAREQACDIKDLASTLLAAAVKDDRFLVCHIGDGVIGCRKSGRLHVVSKPQNGEFANETCFVNSHRAQKYLQLYKGKLAGIDYFMLMSDGTQTSLYRALDAALVPAAGRFALWNSCLMPEAMSNALKETMERVIARNTADDCSIIMMNRIQVENYLNMDLEEKLFLLMMDQKPYNVKLKKKLVRMDNIIKNLQEPTTASELARRVHVRKKYLKRYLNPLLEAGLIDNNRGIYYSLYCERFCTNSQKNCL